MARRRIITFQLGEESFGVDILWVREIIRKFDTTVIDRAPDHIHGLVNLRGQILTVLKPSVLLASTNSAVEKASTCIVIKTSTEIARLPAKPPQSENAITELVGLLIESIGDVVEVDSADIELPAIRSSSPAARYAEGVIKLQGRLILLLNIADLLRCEEVLAETAA